MTHRSRATLTPETRSRRVPGPSSPRERRRTLDAVLERLRLRQALELLQRVVLDLADPLARDAEGAADLLERARRRARQAEAELDHLPLALGQRRERELHVLAA